MADTGGDHDVLITGACGFLGAQVVAYAISQGLKVLATDRAGANPTRLHLLAPGCSFEALDIAGPRAALESVVRRVRSVVHCAAYGVDYRQSDFDTAVQVNILGSAHLLTAAADVGARFIHIGTAYEYGPSTEVQHERTLLNPQGVYGTTKAAGTLSVLDLAIAKKAEAVVFRPFGMYGPLEGRHKLIPSVMRAMLAKTPVDLSPGHQLRDYVFVVDVARACYMAITVPTFPAGQIINLASGVEVELRDLVSAAARAVGGDEALLRWGARPYRPDEVMRVVGTCERAKELLRWAPTTSLSDGMARTAAFEDQLTALGKEI